MGILGDENRFILSALPPAAALKSLLAVSGDSRRQVEYFRDGRTLRSAVDLLSAGNIIRDDSPHFIGGTCQRYHRGFSADDICHLNHISRSVNVRILRSKKFVSDNPSPLIQGKAGVPGDSAVGPDADGQDHHICLNTLSTLQVHRDPGRLLPEMINSVRQSQLYSVLLEMFMEQLRHLPVQRRHNLIHRFNQRDLKPRMTQIFRRFQSDESSSDDGCRFGSLFLHHGVDPISIRHRPERHNPLRINARNRRSQRRRSRRDNQLVIVLAILPVFPEITDRHLLRRPVDGENLRFRPDIHIEPGLHGLFLCYKQSLSRADHSSDIIRKSAVRVGNIFPALQQHDFRALVQPAQSCRAACSRRNSSDNNGFHNKSSFALSEVSYRFSS